MRLLKQDVIFHIKMKDKERFKSDPASVIYQQGKPVDYFVLILEGRVEVTVGRENLVFESGPFTYFGSQALHQNIGIGKMFFFFLSMKINIFRKNFRRHRHAYFVGIPKAFTMYYVIT